MQTIKNAAYAWRQMIFYLSLTAAHETQPFLEWADAHLGKQQDDFCERFAPVMLGLKAISSGAHFERDGLEQTSGGRRFLGWTTERHWLLPPRRETTSASGGH
jgi:hypothetical protein